MSFESRNEVLRLPGSGRTENGFSLLELLVALALGALLTWVLLALTMEFWKFEGAMDSQIRSSQSLVAIPSLLNRYFAASGNGVSLVSGLETQSDLIAARSDLDGPSGFPDGTLTQSFESIQLRARGGGLQVRSGGGSFQPMIPGIDNLRVTRPSLRLIRANVTAVTDWPKPLLHALEGVELELDIFLWNYRPSLLPRKEEK